MHEARLGDVVVSMKNGIYKPSSEYADDGTPCLRMYNIDAGSIVWRDIKRMRISDRELAEYGLHEGDLLVNRVNSRELVGKAACIPPSLEPSVFESKNIRVRLDRQRALPKFINYQLLSRGRRHFANNAQQVVGMASISQGQLADFPIFLTDLDEQHRIVAEIEKQFSRLDEAVTNLKCVKAKLERYRAAALGQATTSFGNCLSSKEPASAELDEMGQDLGVPLPALPQHWNWTTVGKVGSVRGGKRLPLSHKYAAGRTSYPYLRVTDFVEFGIDDSGLQYLSAATRREIERYTISKKDVYISIAGTIGLVGQVPAYLDNANLTENAAKITDLQGVEPKFLVYWLASPTGRRLIAKSTIATTQSKLALFRIEKLPVPLPPVEEQRRIVAEADRRLSIVREVEAEVDANLKRAQALRQAVLAKAFGGDGLGSASSASLAARASRTGAEAPRQPVSHP